MSFNEVNFPLSVSIGSSGGPEFSTNIAISKNGIEQRNANWSQPRLRFNIASRIKTQSDFEIVKEFFYAQKGRAYGFRFKDWSDYQAIAENIATGDGVTTSFQLQKTYSNSSLSTIRTIYKAVIGTVKIYIDSVLQTSGVSIDYNTAIVDFSSPPADGALISADFEFDIPMRFDSDNFNYSLNGTDSQEIADISLIEIK